MDTALSVGTVRDWMTRSPVAVPEETPIADVVHRMVVEEIRHVLVMDGARLSGIVSNRDVRGPAGGPAASPVAPVSSVMTEDPITVSPDTPVTEAARVMLERKIGALPVVVEGGPVGILTRADALEALLACVEQAAGQP